MATNKEVQQSSDASNSGYNLRSRGPTLISPVSQDHAHTVAENVPAPVEEQPAAVNAQPPENIAENPVNIAENPANIAENPENIAVVANNQNEAVMADQAMTAVSLRPAAFGGNQDVARQWWASFVRYIKLAKIEDAQRANLLGRCAQRQSFRATRRSSCVRPRSPAPRSRPMALGRCRSRGRPEPTLPASALGVRGRRG